MKKIEYECGNAEIKYVFPKKKWYENRKKQRSVTIVLDRTVQSETEKMPDILLTIRENEENTIRIDLPEEKNDFILGLLSLLPIPVNNFEELLLFDGDEPSLFLNILQDISSRLNRLTVITRMHEEYEPLFNWLLEENGLIAESEEKLYFSLKEKKKFLTSLVIYNGCNEKVAPAFLPRNAIFLDLSLNEELQRSIRVKRPDITYCSMPNYLDTVVKLRYNTLVKEGILTTKIITNYNKIQH